MSLRNSISRWFITLAGRSGKTNDEILIKKLLRAVENTEEIEFSCDEVFALIDQYAELELQGQDMETVLPLIRHHLEMCKDCNEEYEALLEVLEALPM